MSVAVHWSASLAAGLIATLGLFWLMSLLISGTHLKFQQTEPRKIVEFIRLKHEHRPLPTRRQPPKPPQKEPPPPKPKLAISKQVTPAPRLDIDMPQLDIPLSTRLNDSLLSGISIGQGMTPSSHITPLVRIPPQYPLKARRRRIEGWVKLEFTISREGTVADIRVVESHPRGVFDQAAKRAIARWKFRPLVIDGQPAEQRAVQILEFKLQKR